MSWDRIEHKEIAKCACGNGYLHRVAYTEADDWNRIRSGCYDETIQCDQCKNKYHIEHLIRHCFQPKWVGDGVIDKTYLVPNGQTLQYKTEVEKLFLEFDESLVASYSKEELLIALEEMMSVKYSTHLKNRISIDIVNRYYKKYKKKSLRQISDLVSQCLDCYDDYQWNKESANRYYEDQQHLINKNKQLIEQTLKNSIEIDWKKEAELNIDI